MEKIQALAGVWKEIKKLVEAVEGRRRKKKKKKPNKK